MEMIEDGITRTSGRGLDIISLSDGGPKKAKGSTESVSTAESILKLYKSESVSSSNPKGRPKSGRTWKTEQRARFSAIKKDKVLHTTWKTKMAEKARLKSVKAYENELKEARQQDKEKQKEKRLAKKKRQEENARKSEVVQVIKNTAKIRRMKKKELRKLEKR